MTEHSTAELKRQWDAKRAIVVQARIAADIAEDAYRAAAIRDAEAEFAARGITPGTKVTGSYRLWTETRTATHTETGIYVGHRWGGHRARPDVRAIKKDGTAHGTKTVYGPDNWERAE